VKFLKSKCTAIAIAIFFTLSMTASMMLIPSAHASSDLVTYAYINASPNPTGVNQQVEIIMWVNWVFGTAPGDVFGAELTNSYRFHNYQLVITAPDGANTTETFATVSDPTGAEDYYYTPTAVGTYVLTFYFPTTTLTASNTYPNNPIIGDTYPATSASMNLTVQSTTVAAIPQTPLPTAYWTRPIYGENSAWYTLGSNWLGFGAPGYIGLGYGPNLGGNGEEFGPTTNVGSLTSHIMWTKPLEPGGIVGQTATAIPGNSYMDGSAYEQRFQNPIIVAGMLIYNEPISTTEPESGPTVAVDLQTGQQIWSNSHIPQPSFAYVYDAEDPNEHGVWQPMLVVSTATFNFVTFSAVVSWTFYDAYTGDYLFNVTNIPGQGFFGPAANSAVMIGPEGEYLIISLVNLAPTQTTFTPAGPVTTQIGPPQWYLQEWNSSRIWDNLYSGPSTTPDIPPPISTGQVAVNATGSPTGQPVTAAWTGGYIDYEGSTTYVASCYDFNVSLPWLDSAKLNGALINSTFVTAAIQGDVLLTYAGNLPSNGAFLFTTSTTGIPYTAPYEWFGINLNSTVGTVGSELWSNTLTAPPGNLTVLWAGIDPVTNVFVVTYRETMQFVGYSLLTGKQMWGPTPEQAALDYYGSDGSGSLSDTIAYGNIYSSAYAGILYCYSDTTGNLLWTFGNGPPGSNNSTNSGVETPFGDYPTFVNAVGSGIVYTVTTEHTEETPIFKGAVARAINATTGQQIWTLSDYTGEFLVNSYAMADGYNTMFNSYSDSLYTVGRGPSQTTVNAGPKVTTFGDNVVISGTVMDISAGTKQTEQAADFPSGVPCAADSIMTQWMDYVYNQQPQPTNFVGVPVTIAVTDSNHNCYNIGTVTTDPHGFYTLTWSPVITGNYTVTATFGGTNAYWPSTAETSFNVMSAPPTPAPTASPPSGLASTSTVELGVVAIIIVIIVIGALILVMLSRKRP